MFIEKKSPCSRGSTFLFHFQSKYRYKSVPISQTLSSLALWIGFEITKEEKRLLHCSVEMYVCALVTNVFYHRQWTFLSLSVIVLFVENNHILCCFSFGIFFCSRLCRKIYFQFNSRHINKRMFLMQIRKIDNV